MGYVRLFAGATLASAVFLCAPRIALAQQAQAPADPKLARDAMAVLDKFCASCHGGPSVSPRADRGGFPYVLDVNKLIANGLVVRYTPDESELYQRVRDGEMPPSEVRNRPDRGHLETLRKWIAAGAPAPVSPQAAATGQVITRAKVDQWIVDDLNRARPRDRRHYRYVGLVHLHNARKPAQELDLARKSIAKLVNSLSWMQRIYQPVAIDRTNTVYRIDLRQLGWSRDLWERIVAKDPYAMTRSAANARSSYRATGTLVPYVSADWFVSATSRPPLYHDILRLPSTSLGLERLLRIDTTRNLRGARVVRAGFNRSGVSKHNRVIERHALGRTGYYWRSYDFENSSDKRSVFEHPLGPREGIDSFEPDGGEIIFSLPNGFQAYLLVDRNGRRIDKAPTDVVVDPARRDSAVENGVSCMGCHSLGIIDKNDEIRGHVLKNRRAFDQRNPRTARRALALYPKQETLDWYYKHDRGRFENALTAANAATSVEPINFVAQQFEAELDLATAAAELYLSTSDFRARLERSNTLRRNLGSLLVSGGTVKRDVFISQFPTLVDTLRIGRPLVELAQDARLLRRCDDGGGQECFEVGNVFFNGGEGVARDVRRAAVLYGKACDRNHGPGCSALGVLSERGEGVQRSAARAAQLYDRACRLGHAEGCESLGFLHARGKGVRKDGLAAARLFERACTAGLQSSCAAVADLHFRGTAGVRKDRRRAVQLYQRSCSANHAPSCIELGRIFDDGEGIIKENRAKAAHFLSKACNLGHARSCTKAGKLYYKGKDMPKQRGLAARLFRKACDLNEAEGCLRLARQHRSGKGVRKNKARARELFGRACRLGKKRACLRI